MAATPVRPIWPFLAILLVWQAVSVAFGAWEALYNKPAPVASVVASIVTALGWSALGLWSGMTHHGEFRWLAVPIWLAVIAIMLVTMWTVRIQADGDMAPWNGLLMLLLFFAAVPLHGIASYVPLEQSLAVIVVAAVILVVSLLAFHLGRRVSRRSAPGSGS
jgi:hypothetical protein